ncbi:TetR/AcrR family transcriptional regulator [Thermodesulforhabdus norvegica]|uniref:Transcriptional regulator, TetR family n=1 Tax=Thermodesulforhabdus norvegica TaxID=39841 RepID=A0A1I4UVX9_9BACT|nr:TetR/AcrR family transcriptional regulator [Thermodesulforhabdus norvegica]SFM92903.1 transcriptional regulator, TetR family [Thermodesulforhabdus norvegica]
MSRRTKKIPGFERKAQILRAAQELCAKKGFAGTTLDEIARKAGVSRALVIQHFGSKKGLYEALIDDLFLNHPMEEDPELKYHMEEKDDAGVLRAYCTHAYEHLAAAGRDSPLRLVLFAMLEKPELYTRHYERRKSKGITALEEYIRTRIGDGAFKDVNAHHIATAFSAAVTYLILEEITVGRFGSKEAFMEHLGTFTEALLKGIRKNGDESVNLAVEEGLP